MSNDLKKIINMLIVLGSLTCFVISFIDYIHDDMLHAIYALLFSIVLENSQLEIDDDDEDEEDDA